MADSVDMMDTLVSRYLLRFPDERSGLAALIEQITNEDELDNPKTLPGHVTGSAFVLSPDKTQILLIHHKFLNKWLQPGGHWDPGESDPLTAARREAIEETSVNIAEYLPVDSEQPLVPFDIDTHEIPDRPEKEMPAHLHHDCRYVFVADDLELIGQALEVNDAKWFGFDALECENIRGVIDKLTKHGII